MKLKTVLFDFDGTLVHSIDFLVSIFEKVLSEQNLPPVNAKNIRALIGEPLDEIFRAITPLTEVSELIQKFLAIEKNSTPLLR